MKVALPVEDWETTGQSQTWDPKSWEVLLNIWKVLI